MSAETGEEHSGRVKKDRLVARVPESDRRPLGHDAPTANYRAQVYAPQGQTWTTVSHGTTAEAAASGRTRRNQFSGLTPDVHNLNGPQNNWQHQPYASTAAHADSPWVVFDLSARQFAVSSRERTHNGEHSAPSTRS
ncbi:hypothetical protein AB0N09_05215 [Streptomyces erythrochromogenes]|uniref:hypothetical protein n=1 Tax=Streptomyces erythrochromogenes TaxID=285574 RepID=UPI00343F1B4E